MQRYKIVHRTYYNFSDAVSLGPHTFLLRPREGPELSIESSTLVVSPTPSLRWHRDVEDNAVAVATFAEPATILSIESEVIIRQYNLFPLDFVVNDYATQYPFSYLPEDQTVLAAYTKPLDYSVGDALSDLIDSIWNRGEKLQTYSLLQRLCSHLQQTLAYTLREEPGVQDPLETLALGSGSCRDSAYLFIEASRRLGLAARFVSGYLHAEPSLQNYGATHAWAEVFLPGAGWIGFDPTIGAVVGRDHIAVAVARLPQSVPPVAGSYTGTTGSKLDVGVWVTRL
jgi:transglutaminase-like putative cysteine protease